MKKTTILTFGIASACAVLSANAAIWTGATDLNWNTDTNWNTTQPTGDGTGFDEGDFTEDATINNGHAVSRTGYLGVSDDGLTTTTRTLSLSNSSSLSLTAAMYVGREDDTFGVVNLTDASLTVNGFYAGNDGTGTVSLTNSTLTNSSGEFVLARFSDSNGTLSVTNSTVNVGSGNFFVNEVSGGNATFNMNSGTVTAGGTMRMRGTNALFNLDGGIVTVGGLDLDTDGQIVFSGGQLRVDGMTQAALEGLVGNRITNDSGFALVGGTDGSFATITAVPEPSSAALLGLGGLALILRRRK